MVGIFGFDWPVPQEKRKKDNVEKEFHEQIIKKMQNH
jgi:hypothetical protein